MIDESRRKIIPYFYEELTGNFKKGEEISVFDGSAFFIKDVFLVDIDQNGFLDAVVVGFGSSNIAQLTFVINRNGVLDANPEDHVSMKILKHIPQPFQIFDEETQMLTSYLVVSVNEILDSNRQIVTLTKDNTIKIQDFNSFLSPDCEKPPAIQKFLSFEFGGAFIDLDMDCRPDLLLETFSGDGRTQEIYTYTEKGFCFGSIMEVPVDYGFISFVDLSLRGATDAVFVTQNLEMHVYRNLNMLGDGSFNIDSKD